MFMIWGEWRFQFWKKQAGDKSNGKCQEWERIDVEISANHWAVQWRGKNGCHEKIFELTGNYDGQQMDTALFNDPPGCNVW